jgi:hypothetical protein
LRRTADKSWMRVAEYGARWRLERPMSSSGLYWADDDDEEIHVFTRITNREK